MTLILRLDALAVGLGEISIHAQQDLAGGDGVAFLDQYFLHHAGLGGLHDLEIGLRYQFAISHGDDVEPTEEHPQQGDAEQRHEHIQQDARQGRWRTLLDFENAGGEFLHFPL